MATHFPMAMISYFAKSSSGAKSAGNIVLVLVFSFAALMLASGLLLRAKGSLLGSYFSSSSSISNDVAEYGIRSIVSDLSRTPNRKLLVASKASGSWVTPSNWVTTTSATQNPCAVSSSGVYTPPSAISGVAGTSKANVNGNSDRQFWLREVTYREITSTGSRVEVGYRRSSVGSAWSIVGGTGYTGNTINLAGVTRGYIVLQVQGEATQNAKTSTSVITREFELVPKCCGRSYGYTYASLSSPVQSFGQDLRSCPAAGLGVLNLVTGANGNGIFNINGKSFDLWENAIYANQDQAITLNPSDAKSLDGDTNLVPTGQQLPPQIDEPAGIPNSACIFGNNNNSDLVLPAAGTGGSPSLSCDDGASSTTITVYQDNGNANKTKGKDPVYSCPSDQFSVFPNTAAVIPDGSIVQAQNGSITTADYRNCYVPTTSTTSTPQPYCIESPSGSNSWYCRIRYIDSFSKSIVVDSSGGKTVTLLFTDKKSTGSGGTLVLGGSASFAGNGGFAHFIDGANATIADSFRFRLVNDVLNSNFQLVGASGALAGFFDLRYSNVILKGGGANTNINLSGILWSNNLTLAGNAVLVNPPSGNCSVAAAAGTTCAILQSLYPDLFDNDPTNDDLRPAFDFTPRTVFTLRSFGI